MCMAVLFALIATGGCTTNKGLQLKNRLLATNNNELLKKQEWFRDALASKEKELQEKQDALTRANAERNDLKKKLGEFEEATQAVEGQQQVLQARMAEALKGHECEIIGRGDDIVIRANVGFFSGGVEIDKDGQKLLLAIAEAVRKNAAGYQLQVEGHTDDKPIQQADVPSNWELSGARALSVLHFLVDRCGLSPERLSFAGYGEYAPIVPNTDIKSRARNRRVEIILKDAI